MDSTNVISIILHGLGYLALLIGLIWVGSSSYITVQQQQVGIITRFGKFLKIAPSGLNFKVPFIDNLMKCESLQNRTSEIKFQAVTQDQANVSFNALLLYSALNSLPETIQNIAFKFRTDQEFTAALIRTIEGEVRAYVATKRQAEVLLLRADIVEHVKTQLDTTLESWGFHLLNLQMNDISFGTAITSSMEKVVASANLRIAAENEGQALLITKTKAAEAEGNAIKISAQAEKEAATLRGQGIASFREEVAKGMAIAATEMGDDTASATTAILFSMYLENMKEIAVNGKGSNVLFFDGSAGNFQQTLKQIQSGLIPKGENTKGENLKTS